MKALILRTLKAAEELALPRRFEGARLQARRQDPNFCHTERASQSAEKGPIASDLKGHGFSRAVQVLHFSDSEWASAHEATRVSTLSTVSLLALALAALMLLAACTVHVDDKDKDAKKVDIQTPLANLKVDTSEAATDNGIPVYPGATPRPEANGDKHRANVNIGAMGFGIKVIAAEYNSPDSPERVKDFYLDKLKKFGNVLECHGTGGDHGADGHWDGDELDKPVTCGGTKGDGWELKVGTNHNQHLVAIKPDGSGTRIGTVLVQIHGKEGTL